jgi:hypothetical protein
MELPFKLFWAEIAESRVQPLAIVEHLNVLEEGRARLSTRGEGLRGKHQDILDLRCQRCQTVFSSREGTPLYCLKTKPEQVEMGL